MANHSWSHFDAHVRCLLNIVQLLSLSHFSLHLVWLCSYFQAKKPPRTLITIQCQLCWCSVHTHTRRYGSIHRLYYIWKCARFSTNFVTTWLVGFSFAHAKRWSSFNLFRNPSAIILATINTNVVLKSNMDLRFSADCFSKAIDANSLFSLFALNIHKSSYFSWCS